jgi:zona occludens toxin
MVDLLTGVPGSGKTYKAVHHLYDLCLKSPKKYKHIYTNINGLDYKKINQLAKEPDYVQPFDFQNLKIEIIQEYDFHQLAKVGELHVDDYDDFIKNEGIYKKYIHSLIVIDECHLFFEAKAQDSLIRFLSYHRHFDIDIILITQNKNLIDKKYLSFIETMYVALPSSKRLFSFNFMGLNLLKFRYRKYASYQEYHANIIGTDSIPFLKEVYELYNSGGNTVGKSAVGRFTLPLIIMIIVTFIGYKFVSDRFSKKEPEPVQNQEQINPQPKENKAINRDIPVINTNNTFFIADCFSNSCHFQNTNTTFKKDTMMVFVNKFECKILVNEIISNNYSQYILSCSEKFSELLDKFKTKNNGVKQDEKDDNRPLINPFNSNGK